MENDHLRFACPSCGANLTLPAAAAGVEGPCPQCGSLIRAPRPKAVRLEVPETAPPRAKPVATTFHAPTKTAQGSKVVLSYKRARFRRGAAIVASLVLIVVAAWVVMSQGKGNDVPPPSAGPAKTDPKQVGTHALPQPLSTPAPAGIDPAMDPRVPPEGMDVRALIQASADVLKTFLHAKTLGERLPIIETKTPKEELEASVLAKPIPARQRFQSIEVRFDKVGGATDVIFLGELELATGGAEGHVLMVRKRGTQPPKIMVDPFLDGYGGRLKNFAAKPSGEQRTFQVVASFFSFCNDPNVPQGASKFTAKLSEAPARPEIAEAYFAMFSPVKERLEKLGVRYGHSTGVTFTLRWNAEEDPARPFLEIVNVRSLDWDD